MEENEIIVEEITEEKNSEPKPVEQNSFGDTHNALVSFILSIIGLELSPLVLPGLIISIIALGKIKKCDESGFVTKNPYKVFRRIAKPVSIVGLALSLLFILIWACYVAIILIAVKNG